MLVRTKSPAGRVIKDVAVAADKGMARYGASCLSRAVGAVLLYKYYYVIPLCKPHYVKCASL